MHERTGAIAKFETDEDAEMAGFEPVGRLMQMKGGNPSPEQVERFVSERLMPMNRQERRAWASQQRKSQKSY